MAETHPNILILIMALEAFNRGDMEALKKLAADDIVYRVPGDNQVSGSHRGIEGFIGILAKQRELTADTMKLQPNVILADDNHVVLEARVTAERDGKALDTQNCYVFTISGGKIEDMQLFLSDQKGVDAFFN